MKIVHARDRSSMKIYGDHSPCPVIADSDVVEKLGGPEAAFHEIKRIERFLPAQSTETHPLNMTKLAFARENEERGEKYWQWRRMQQPAVRESTGYDSVWGFGHPVDDGFVFVNSENRQPVYHIKTGEFNAATN